MKKDLKNLLIIYLLIVTLKIITSIIINSPSIFTDEYLYSKMARNILLFGESSYHDGVIAYKYLPLYSFVISLSYLFSDMEIIYFVMKIINALTSSLILIPSFLLAKEFINSKKSLFIALIISLFVGCFNISNYIMSENLFYPLFMFYIYFGYLGFKTNKSKYFIFSGVLMGLSYWTRAFALIMIPTLLFTCFFYRTKIKNLFFHYLSWGIIIVPAFLNKLNTLDSTGSALTSGYGGPWAFLSNFLGNPLGFFNWIGLYIAYMLIATGFIFGIYYLLSFKVKDKKFRILLTIITIFFIINVLVIANQANGSKEIYESPFFPLFSNRPIGRYLEVSISSILLLGMIAAEKFKFTKKHFKVTTFFSSITLLLGTQLTIVPLFPFNNSSLTLIGSLDSILEYLLYGEIFLGSKFTWIPFIILAIILTSIPLLIYTFKNYKKQIIILGISFILLTSFGSLMITSINSNTWEETNQARLGHWFNENLNGDITLDERFITEKLMKENIDEDLFNHICEWSLIGFWINEDIFIANPLNETIQSEYIITMDNTLPYNLIRKEGEFYIFQK